MSLHETYFGGFGPFEHDDAEMIDADRGDTRPEAALATTGKVTAGEAPTADNDVIRRQDLAMVAASLLSVVAAETRRQLGIALETAMRLDTERGMRMSLAGGAF